MIPSLIFDLILLLIFVIFVALGAHRGFVLTLCGLLAVFVAFFGASLVSNILCEPMAEAIRPTLERRIDGVLRQSIQREYSGSASEDVPTPEELPLEDVPAFLKNSAFYQNLAQSFRQAVEQGVTSVTGNAAQSLAGYAARELARAVLFLLSFLVILVAWFLISHALDLVAKLPVLSTVNQVGGGVIGAARGFLILCVCAWVFHGALDLLPPEIAEGSRLLPFLLHPMELIRKVQAWMGGTAPILSDP